MSMSDKAKIAALSVVISQALEYLEKDPEQKNELSNLYRRQFDTGIMRGTARSGN